MNFYTINSIYITAMLIFASPLYGMSYWEQKFNDYFHSAKGLDYAKNTNLINIFQNIRGFLSLAYHRLTHNKENILSILSDIKDKFQSFDIWLQKQEADALLAIKAKYRISDDIWIQLCTDIERLKKSYTIGMTEKNENPIETSHLDKDIKKILFGLLKLNKINPANIIISIADFSANGKTESITVAQTKSQISFSSESDKLIISDHYRPSSLQISPQLKDMSYPQKVSYLAHEIQHLIHHHALTEVIVTEYLKYYYKVDINEFKQSHEYKQLSKVHEAQAELYAAMQHPYIAQCLKKLRLQKFYPNHLYEDHFFHLSTIAMWWKVHEKLEVLL